MVQSLQKKELGEIQLLVDYQYYWLTSTNYQCMTAKNLQTPVRNQSQFAGEILKLHLDTLQPIYHLQVQLMKLKFQLYVMWMHNHDMNCFFVKASVWECKTGFTVTLQLFYIAVLLATNRCGNVFLFVFQLLMISSHYLVFRWQPQLNGARVMMVFCCQQSFVNVLTIQKNTVRVESFAFLSMAEF